MSEKSELSGLCYDSGEEIHAGDYVYHMGRPGRVVFVIDRDEYSAEFPREAWQRYGHGFMIKDQFGLYKYDEPEEVIQFIRRAM